MPDSNGEALPKCFIIMPITTPDDLVALYGNDTDHFKHVMEHLFFPAIKKCGYDPVPPVMTGSDIIHAEIIKRLEIADVVLCDMSSYNANVFFELGIRTALDKPVCIVRDEFSSKVPFDTMVINYHVYDGMLRVWEMQDQVDKMSEHLQNCINNSGGKNPLWRYFGLTSRAEPAVGGSAEEKIDMILSALSKSPSLYDVSDELYDNGESDYDVFKHRAKMIAKEVNATVVKFNKRGDKVTLDMGPYGLAKNQIESINKLGESMGYSVNFVGRSFDR